MKKNFYKIDKLLNILEKNPYYSDIRINNDEGLEECEKLLSYWNYNIVEKIIMGNLSNQEKIELYEGFLKEIEKTYIPTLYRKVKFCIECLNKKNYDNSLDHSSDDLIKSMQSLSNIIDSSNS